jgi:hypothetical protein
MLDVDRRSITAAAKRANLSHESVRRIGKFHNFDEFRSSRRQVKPTTIKSKPIKEAAPYIDTPKMIVHKPTNKKWYQFWK